MDLQALNFCLVFYISAFSKAFLRISAHNIEHTDPEEGLREGWKVEDKLR